MTDEYQPRTPERLIEVLRSRDQNPRSWDQEAADLIERLLHVAAPAGCSPGSVHGWEVEVRVNGDSVLTIGHNHLAGIENIDDYKSVVENCARHLLAFIGGSVAVAQPSREAREKEITRLATIEECKRIADAVAEGAATPNGQSRAKLISERIAALSASPPSPIAGEAAANFCQWLDGYLIRMEGRDELTAFEANTIRAELQEKVLLGASVSSTEGHSHD